MKKKSWTIMVYLAGDNNLDDAGVADLTEIKLSAQPTTSMLSRSLIDKLAAHKHDVISSQKAALWKRTQ